jgi:Tol biopolymer transport system component
MTQSVGRKRKRTLSAGLLAGWIAIIVGPDLPVRAANANSGTIGFEGDTFSPWGLSAMEPDGSGVVDLQAPLGAADLSWSPNGQRVAFEADPNGDGNLEVFVMDADGTNLLQLTDSAGRDYWPDWFPDGQRIAFTSERNGAPNIYVMNADGSDQVALTDDPDVANMQPDVSPNGQHILFQRESFVEPPTIWVMNADGSDRHALTAQGLHADTDPQWSPNGRTIVFSSNREGTFEIYVMEADGADPVQLTASPGADITPTFSPDGQHIAWSKIRGIQGDIWLMNRDGSGQVNITNSPQFEGFPDWHQGNLRKD